MIVDKIKTEIVDPAIYLLITLAAIYFIWGVFLFIKDYDNEEGRTKGKKHLIWGIIGLFIMLSVQAIVSLMIDQFG